VEERRGGGRGCGSRKGRGGRKEEKKDEGKGGEFVPLLDVPNRSTPLAL
jgi:hypothetical protein